MIYQYLCTDQRELDEIAHKVLNDAGAQRFFILSGPMGAGKTTFVKSLCRALDIKDVISSPTYAIMNEYHRQDGDPVFHFDFYRIRSESEAYDLGYEQFFFSKYYCFVEWPEKIESLLKFPKASIFISLENNHRIIELHTEDQPD